MSTVLVNGEIQLKVCREMDGDNHNAPCFSPKGFVLLSANRHQASRQEIDQQY